jgi:hypothetical protein
MTSEKQEMIYNKSDIFRTGTWWKQLKFHKQPELSMQKCVLLETVEL